jgi:hypothetical protein
MLLSFSLAVIGYSWTISYYESVDEAMLKDENDRLKLEWNILHEQVNRAQNDLAELIKKDDYNYRFMKLVPVVV